MTPDLQAWDAAAAPAVATLLVGIKSYLPKNWTHFTPLLAIALGIVYALTARPGCAMSPECAVAGVQVGLMAVGLHSAIKNNAEKPTHKKVVADPKA